ncbi:MAG: hypothetical protein HUK21_11500, partial [Fibrobacteraceae bacterium]|nr:hypothetical protein [Fibrobacteraceae bacterium]
AGMKYDYGFDSSSILKVSNDTLYAMLKEWKQPIVYRRTNEKNLPKLPTPTDSVLLSVRDFYKYRNDFIRDSVDLENGWFRERKVGSVQLQHLDSTEHTHFVARPVSNEGTDNIVIAYKDSIADKDRRPHEYVEMVGRLNNGIPYDISYLRDSTFQYIGTFTGTGKNQRLGWFDVNRLQGNTAFILTWGGSNGSSNIHYSQYNMNVGRNVGVKENNAVRSLLGEVSVSFNSGTLERETSVTVRTASAEDYGNFNVFNDAPLTGPIVEVLPSMEFHDSTNYPRIQMKISRKEIEQAGIAPDRVRLYKVDFKNGRFVPLSHVLYGYLKADGRAAIDGANADSATCVGWNNSSCYDDQWAYMLISGETATFSVFAALDSARAGVPELKMEVLPAIATSLEREIRVIGATDFE